MTLHCAFWPACSQLRWGSTASLHSMSSGALQTPSKVSRSPPSLCGLGWFSLIQSDQKQHGPEEGRPKVGPHPGRCFGELPGTQRSQSPQDRPSYHGQGARSESRVPGTVLQLSAEPRTQKSPLCHPWVTDPGLNAQNK